RERLHVELDIGALARRIGAGEQAELRRRHGERPAAKERVVERHAQLAEGRMIERVERLRAGDLVDQPKLQMVLQVLADAGLVEHDRYAELLRAGGGPDAREQQDLRRADRARRQDDLAPAARLARLAVLAPAHARRALAVERNAFDQASGLEPQVRPMQHRLEKAARRRPAPAALLVHMEVAGALVVAAVEIIDRLDARLRGGGAEIFEQIPAHARLLDAPFAANRVRVARAEEMMLVLLEVGQHVVPAPAGEAELAPVIVIGRLPAHVDHGVYGGRAADHLAARIVEAASVEA